MGHAYIIPRLGEGRRNGTQDSFSKPLELEKGVSRDGGQ